METVRLTRSGLAQFASELDPDQRENIESALSTLESLIESNPESGDPNLLKSLHSTLDQATKPLAELMMDKAMETMLRKRGLLS